MLHHHLLHVLEEALGLRSHELVALCREGNGEMRLSHYPARPGPRREAGLRRGRAEHAEEEDTAILTFRLPDPRDWLEHGNSVVMPLERQKARNTIVARCGGFLQRRIRDYLGKPSPLGTCRGVREHDAGLYSVEFVGRPDATASQSGDGKASCA